MTTSPEDAFSLRCWPAALHRAAGTAIALVVALVSAVAWSAPPLELLVVQSYHRGQAWSEEVERGLEEGFAEAGVEVEIFVEYLDALRFPITSPADVEDHVGALERRIRRRPPAALLVVDDSAFDLVVEHRDRIGKGLPLIFAGVDRQRAARVDGRAAIAGVTEAPSFRDTLELALRMRPHTDTVILVGDPSARFADVRQAFDVDLRKLGRFLRTELVLLADIESAVARVRAAGPNSVVMLAARLADREGRLLPDSQVARRISDASPVPVFSGWSSFLGHGIVGGRLVSGRHQGRDAARLVIRLAALAGGAAPEAPWPIPSPNPYAFDDRELQRWGLDSVDLPAGSEVLNRVPAMWEDHRLFILAVAAGTVTMVSAIVVLARRMRRSARSEAPFRAGELRFRELFENVSIGLGLNDTEGRFVQVNARLCETLGRTAEELRGGDLAGLFAADDFAPVRDAIRRMLAGELRSDQRELPLPTGGGNRPSWVSLSVSAVHDADGRARLLICVVEDITERRQAEARLRQSGAVLESTSEAVMISDPAERVIAVNRAFSVITGYAAEDVVGYKPMMLLSGRHDADFFESIWHVLIRDGHWQGEIWTRCKSGEVLPLWTSISEIRDEDGEIGNYVSVMSDISALKASQAELEHLAGHDALTGLPNRLLFNARLEHAVQRARREDGQVVLLFLDLDRFKSINDSLGHHVGDALLKEIARRLLNTVRGEDTVARLGGDEFVVILEGHAAGQSAEIVARKLVASVSAPLNLPGLPPGTRIGTSIGIAVFPRDGFEPAALLRNADTAMYRAKEDGRGTFRYYSEEMGVSAVDRFMLENELRAAIDDGQIEIHYQPLVRLSDGRVFGAEALARWRHPRRGLLFPARFIGLAEECGLIVPLGQQILEQACRFAARMHGNGYPLERIAVNVSPLQIGRDDFVENVAGALRRSGLPGQALELEITENFVMSNTPRMVERLAAVTALGVSFAVDDFGTGYSNLAQLKCLPISKLKIDRGFVEGLPEDLNDLAIVRAVISLGRNLGFTVIAEGVESAEQAALLQHEGCSEGQGNLFSRPLDEAAFVRLLAKESDAAAETALL